MSEGAVGGRFIGQSVARVEDPRLLAGRGRFVADVMMRGAVHAAFVRSDMARAKLRRVDVARARSAPGVFAVLTAADLNTRLAGSMLPSLYIGTNLKVAPLRPLADEDVRFVGDPIAVVLATDRYLAEDAVELVEVEYEALTPIIDYELAAASPLLVHSEETSNVVANAAAPMDDQGLKAMRDASVVVTETFRQHRYAPVPLETRGVVARWDAHDRRLDVWISSQNPHEVRSSCSRITGVPEHRIRVQIGDVGGGFGQKAFMAREEQVIVLAAHLTGRTVKWIEDRRENLIAASHARTARATVSMGVDEGGNIVGATIDHLEDVGSYQQGGGSAHTSVCLRFPLPYRIPHMGWTSTVVWTNTCGRAAYRAPWMMEAVAREAMVEIVARRIGLDPLEFRRRNVLHREELPHATATGVVVDNVSPEETLEAAAKAIHYEAFRSEQVIRREEGHYLGIGTCLYIEPQTSAGPYRTEAVHIRMGPAGDVHVYLGSGAHGQGLETTTAQLAADFLGLDFASVSVHQGDTNSTPFGPGTGGSRSGPMIGAAVQASAQSLRMKLLRIASHLLEADTADLLLENGRVTVRGTPTVGISLSEIAATAHFGSARLPAGTDIGLDVVERYVAPDTLYSNACHICTVSVDIHTGAVHILRYVVAEDCGQMINPAIVEGQISGGVAQGIGGALYEHSAYDSDGNPLAGTLLDYLLPGVYEIPHIEFTHLSTPGSTPGGYKGVGEGGAIGAPPAIFNAVADALAPLGVHLTEQPLDPSRLHALIREAERSRAAASM